VCDTMQRGRTDAMAVCARMTALVIFGISLLVITDVMSVAACQSVGGKGTAGDDLQLRTGDQLRLKDFAMLMSHDSATGCAGTFNELERTQRADLIGQLNAGVRVLDIRPFCFNQTVHLHHGFDLAEDNPSVEDAIVNVTKFAAEDGNRDLYILLFSRFDGFLAKENNSLCEEAVHHALKKNRIDRGLIYCSEEESIVDRTVADIKANHTSGGEFGHVLALDRSCAEQNYDQDIECFDGDGKSCTNCDKPLGQHDQCFDDFGEYWSRTIAKARAARTRSTYGKLQIMQAHYQYNPFKTFQELKRAGGITQATQTSLFNGYIQTKLRHVCESDKGHEEGYGIVYQLDDLAIDPKDENNHYHHSIANALWEDIHRINGFVHIPKRPYIVT